MRLGVSFGQRSLSSGLGGPAGLAVGLLVGEPVGVESNGFLPTQGVAEERSSPDLASERDAEDGRIHALQALSRTVAVEHRRRHSGVVQVRSEHLAQADVVRGLKDVRLPELRDELGCRQAHVAGETHGEELSIAVSTERRILDVEAEPCSHNLHDPRQVPGHEAMVGRRFIQLADVQFAVSRGWRNNRHR